MRFIKRFETLVLYLILGMILPTIGLLAGWWGGVPFLPEKWIVVTALAGALLGLVVDVLLLRRWVRQARTMDIRIWMLIHLFYSACIFGFFMGVPLFHALLALPAGFVIGGRLLQQVADPAGVRRAAKNTAVFTTLVLALVCIASASVALASPSTPADLQGMLGLKFTVTQGMVIALVMIGGLGLLVFNWVLAGIAVRFCFTFLQRNSTAVKAL